MQEHTRKNIIIGLGAFLVVLLGAWWYSGFTLEFMKFFAAEPTPSSPVIASIPRTPLPPTIMPGCYYQQVECIRAPCNPQLVCPEGSLVTCSPATQDVAIGGNAVVTATGGVAPYTWFAPHGLPTGGAGATFTVRYTTAGIKKVTVQSPRLFREGVIPGGPVVDNVFCTIVVR